MKQKCRKDIAFESKEKNNREVEIQCSSFISEKRVSGNLKKEICETSFNAVNGYCKLHYLGIIKEKGKHDETVWEGPKPPDCLFIFTYGQKGTQCFYFAACVYVLSIIANHYYAKYWFWSAYWINKYNTRVYGKQKETKACVYIGFIIIFHAFVVNKGPGPYLTSYV